jgi:hypothetical protein
MRKASIASFAVGIFAIGSSIFQSILASSVLNPIESAILAGHFDSATIALIAEAMNTILPMTLIIEAITVLLTMFFAYYTFAVGGAYEVGSMKIAGPAYVILQLAAIPVLLASYELFPLLPELISNPSAVMSQVLGIVALMLIGGLAAIVFLLIFIVTFLIGLNRMKTETGVALFQTAMWLAIIGIVLSLLNSLFSAIGVPFNIGSLLLQIAIIVFGFALSQAGREGRVPGRLRDRVEKEQA